MAPALAVVSLVVIVGLPRHLAVVARGGDLVVVALALAVQFVPIALERPATFHVVAIISTARALAAKPYRCEFHGRTATIAGLHRRHCDSEGNPDGRNPWARSEPLGSLRLLLVMLLLAVACWLPSSTCWLPPAGFLLPPTGCCLLASTSCLLYTSPSPRDMRRSRMPSSA